MKVTEIYGTHLGTLEIKNDNIGLRFTWINDENRLQGFRRGVGSVNRKFGGLRHALDYILKITENE